MRDSLPLPKGRGRIHRVHNQGLLLPTCALQKQALRLPPNRMPRDWGVPLCPWQHNDILYSWATIVGPQLSDGDRKYRIAGMYIEFENTASPGDPVTVPNVTRANARPYYDGLADSADRDYIRVPITAVRGDTSDEDVWPIAEGGNLLTFFAQTTGLVGVHGKPFSDADNSTVIGGALIAMLDEDDPTQDRILSRLYLEADSQVLKRPPDQIGLEWELELG